MELFMVQHIPSIEDDSEKIISPNVFTQDSNYLFSDVLQSIIQHQNFVSAASCDSMDNNNNVLGEDWLPLLNTTLMHYNVLEAAAQQEKMFMVFDKSMIANIPNGLGKIPVANAAFTQYGVFDGLTNQHQISMIDNALTQKQTFGTTPVALESFQTPSSLIVQEVTSNVTQQQHGAYRLDPLVTVTVDKSDGVSFTEKVVREVNLNNLNNDNSNNSSIYSVHNQAQDDSDSLGIYRDHKQGVVQKLQFITGGKGPQENVTVKGMSEHPESYSSTNQKEHAADHGYIILEGQKLLQEELTPLVWAKGPDYSQEILMQLADRINVLLASRRAEMEVHIKPEELGKVVVKVIMESGAMSVKITAESQFVKDFLQSHEHELKSLLAQEGYNLAHLDVNIGHTYQQSQWNNTSSPAWLGCLSFKAQKVRSAAQVQNLQMTSVTCYDGHPHKFDCFA